LPWPVARPDDDCRRGRGLAIQICNQRLAKSALDHIPD